MAERSSLRYAWPLVLVVVAASSVSAAAPTEDEIREILKEAKRNTSSIHEQAQALARLAWPSQKPVEHRLAYAARKQLAGYGEHGLAAMREAVQTVDPIYRADVVAALLEARRRVPQGLPPDLLPAFEDAIWFGSIEAQRLAMREIAQLSYERAVLPIIDAVVERPVLLLPATVSLGRLGQARAAYFLDAVLRAEEDPLRDPRIRAAAAQSLAALAGNATAVLRAATRSERREVRQTAITALVPIAGIEDLTALHEYVARHPDDDQGVLRMVEKRVTMLESLMDQDQSGELVAPPEF